MKKKVYWNAGIFSFRIKTFVDELRAQDTSLYSYWRKNYDEFVDAFGRIKENSFDYAVMQKTDRAALVEFEARWSDLGSWESVHEYFSKSSGNFSIGKAEFLDSEDCFAFSRDKLVSVLGMKDLLVVEDSDSVLVTRKGYSDKVKALTQHLKGKRIDEVHQSRTVYRPWGYYTVLKEKKNYKVKEIGVYPGKYVSLQKHKHRSEHWNVVRGAVQVFLKNKSVTIKRNQGVYVPKGVKHRIQNTTGNIAIII
jgi:mannose-1-phosphate guanylyltransferase/mannose-6-phosphate isomerase